MERTEQGIQFIQQQSQQSQEGNIVLQPEAMARHERVKQCFELLEADLQTQSDKLARELISSSDQSGACKIKPSNKNNKSYNKKKKKKRNKKGEKGDSDDGCMYSNNGSDKQATTHETTESLLQMTRLQDGRIAITAPGEIISDKDDLAPIHHPALPIMPTTPSVNSMFRQRFQNTAFNHHDNDDDDDDDITPTPAKAKIVVPATAANNKSEEIDAVMDALCLDVSMLLYTPHGMALCLSPCQLDAVEQILQKQVQSIHEARRLQCKMHRQQEETNNKEDGITTPTASLQ